MKLHHIIITFLFSIVVIVGVGMFFTEIDSSYGIDGYNDTHFEKYEEALSAINETSQQTKRNIEAVQANPLIPDPLGIIAVGGIGAAKTASQTGDIILVSTAGFLEFLPFGALGNVLIAVFAVSLLVVFFVGIILHFVSKSERT